VKALLMGGQACVFYGAAEFSRDLDLAILADSENLARLRTALDELDAEPVAIPPLREEWMQAGHAAHFRCGRADVANLRIDVMAKMRGVEEFAALWHRRTTIQVDQDVIDLMSLQDLVKAKKTQRDKDWPMIRRLVERDYLASSALSPEKNQPEFWLMELRTSELLIEACRRFPAVAAGLITCRPLLRHAVNADIEALESALDSEERAERTADREYWQPMRQQLEELRRQRPRPSAPPLH
jgi:hypothetical protein